MKAKFYLILIIVLIKSSWQYAQAQTFAVSGKVTSAFENEALPGVNVLVQGSNTGTVTDIEGNYNLNVSDPNSTLIFSFVGYLSEEAPIEGRPEIDIKLVEDIQSLSEVVVVGYGTVKKSDLTGSVSSIEGEDLNAFPTTNPVQALAGRAAGVQVKQNTGAPGGGISVRIRGTNSIQGGNEPLYVIDGFPYSGTPTILNNNDIESMEILKDASATAIYGSRGANGVVLITTKRGKAGATRVDYEGSYGIQTLRKKLDLMNATEYAEFYNEQAVNDGLEPYFSQDEINNFGEGTDWQDEVYQAAPLQNHSLTVSGGNDKTQFSISGSHFNQKGIIPGSDYVRNSLRANVNHDISKKFSLNTSVIVSRIDSDRKNSGGGNRGRSLIGGTISAPPTLSLYNDDGTYRDLATVYPFISNVLTHPFNYIYEQNDHIRSNKVLANAAVTYMPIEGLSIKVSGGIENSDDRVDGYTTTDFINSSGSANVDTDQRTSLLNENIISYAKTIGKNHSISATAGVTYQNSISTSLGASGAGFISNVTESHDLGSAAILNTPGTGYSDWSLLSYLSRFNYSLNEKYLVTASFRADGSSRFAEGEKWGYFPSAALAWRISEEQFIKNIPFISNLKLRAGFGATGNTAIGPYTTLNLLNAGKTVFDDQLFTNISPGTRLPENLKWETTMQTDFGIDVGIFDNRFRLTADYYIKNTTDLLNRVSLPSSLGYLYTIRNVGEIQNKGFELALDANILTGNFNWDVSTNISFNRNEVIKLYGREDILGSAIYVGIVNDNINILREGKPLGVFYGYVEEGYDENGKIVYKDLVDDGSINQDDKTIIGDPNPDFIYGFNSNMSFKNFDLNIFIQGSQGNDIFNLSSVGQTTDYGFGLNMLREVLYDHWTPETPNAKYPKISRSTNVRVSDRFVEDGSYLRLRNIQLAYNLPVSNLNIGWLRNAQVYVSGQNLITLTKYSWFDPEINSYGGSSSILQGIDHYSYPTTKTLTLGLKLGF